MTIHHKNLSIFSVYSLLSVLMGISGASTIISVLMPVLFLITGSSMPISFGMKVSLETPNEGNMALSSGYIISQINGDLLILHESTLNVILTSLVPILIFGSVTLSLFLLRKVFKNVYDGNYFLPQNRKIMYQVAALCIIVPVVSNLLKRVVLMSLPAGLMINGMKVKLPDNFGGWSEVFFSEYIVLGFFFILFARVFNEGAKLKEEVDLTV